MDKKRILKIAAEEGFTNAAVISTDQLLFNYNFRELCKENDCGNYGANYACPPGCGAPEEMESRVLAYEKAIVFETCNPVDNSMDPAQTKPLKKMHMQMTRSAMKHMEREGFDMDGFFIMCGPCSICTPCAIIESRPCPHEDMRSSCLSAYCISVNELADVCGIDLEWSGNQASFFSLYVYQKRP